MTVYELNKDQLTELKQGYLIQLDDEGMLEEITGLDAVYWGTLADADEIIPDDVIFNHYEDFIFTEDDFTCEVTA